MPTTIPWYILDAGTKSYMTAAIKLTGGNQVDNEDYPSVIWRKSNGNSYTFAINGEYMSNYCGMGILSAIMYEMSSYQLYPVANAQTVLALNFPSFSYENEELMDRIYSRTSSSVYRNVLWPDISALSNRLNLKMTFMVTPQFDYEDVNQPNTSEIEYFFKLFKEIRAEAGLTTARTGTTSLEKKFTEDTAFYKKSIAHFKFLSLYCQNEDLTVVKALRMGLLDSVRTYLCDYTGKESLFSYESSDTLNISSFTDGSDFTFYSDFMLKNIETALAYSSIRYDMTDIYSAQESDELWNRRFENFSTTLATYWEDFPNFDRCTVSTADQKIRRLLSMDYTYSRDGKKIKVNINHFEEECFFILRTHNETVTQVTGGSYKKLEDGAYLITVKDENPTITLEESNDLFYKKS
jgi:hypothetical protein